MKEVWKDIPGFKGLYQASSLGRFKNLRNGKFLNPTFPDTRNTGVIGLRNRNNIYKTFAPSRIIAELFIPNPNKLEIVKYKKEKDNLHPSNLYWISVSDKIKEWAKLRTRTVYEFTCQNKDCGKKFNRITGNRKYKYCSKKCAKNNLSKQAMINMSECKKKKVIAIKYNKKIIFNSINDAGDYLILSPSTISNVLAGRQKTADGYAFKFLK